jgi:glutathione S-transferase
MQLYSGPLSLFTAKVRIALDEKRLAYERIEVGWSLASRYEPHHPEVVARNPKAQVPVLVDGDLTVYDSTQILEYLEDRYPDPPLLPASIGERARCRRLEAAADELYFPSVWSLIEEAFYPPGPRGRDAERRAGARASIAEQNARLDAELGDRIWLCDRFSFADVATFVFVRAASAIGAPIAPEHASLGAWFARCLGRPAVAREVDAMNRFLANVLAGARSAA